VTPQTQRLLAIVERFARQRVLVVGDVMLDEFVWGKVSRVSPEAPVPVVEVTREDLYPGGAANVARNLKDFAGAVHLMGLTGADAQAARLRQLLTEDGIGIDCLALDPARRTTVKTRIIARQQQVVRVDREQKSPPSPAQSEAALGCFERLLPDLDAVIVADYAKGFLGQDFADRLSQAVARAGKILTVDPAPRNPLRWSGATAIKPNRPEAFEFAGMPYADAAGDPSQDQALLKAAATLLTKWAPATVLITLGEQGMLVLEQNCPPLHTPTRAKEIYDVSGAGDTAIALFTLALAAGASAADAAEIANHASGIAVGKLGTAPVTRRELLDSLAGV
jgi:D-beta-D-heptose 7-phosphate kinase/D-beta-D-heptose 1-phosphate adenosyltransferase